jgi:predicted metalloprotease with PDZ domain
MFHMWNGGVIAPASADELWLLEGGTEFYTTDTLFRTGRFPPVTWLGTYNWHAERVAELERQLDISLLEACRRAMAEGGAVKDFAYWKGRLFFFLLNEKVRPVTGGSKSMDDVMRELYRRNSPVTNESILVSLGWGREGRSPLKALSLRGDRSPAPGLVL